MTNNVHSNSKHQNHSSSLYLAFMLYSNLITAIAWIEKRESEIDVNRICCPMLSLVFKSSFKCRLFYPIVRTLNIF